ncbi:hypothetical protein [Streptomyces sp. NBC_00233]|uniref:hypothetical protein n=1 Tax=Streptomyces sp. NBC_00233 TaxID=2975686 RepID=UPI0022592274|nr:hypothetical protein [Streptomyces sp. NBC_00233]MCX5229314.1 hypothetical protein [Streptomyces sp. NBC_00233]
MTRSENEVDQIVFRWDSENLTGSTGFGPVAWSGPREEAENLFRMSGPVLRASGEETRPALIRLQRRSEVMLIHRTPFTDADGGTSVLCHALVGAPGLLEPATCLGLHAWNWEGAAMDGARVRGQLPVIPERVLVPATGHGQGELDSALEGATEEITGMVAELLRHPDERFTVLDERGDSASPVLWGLHSMFGGLTGRRWTFATHDTVELTALRFVFVGRWSGAASRNTDRRRVDPRERVGDRAEEIAARLVRHHLRGVAEGEGQEYAVGSALHGASSARGASLLETAVRALDVLDGRRPGGYAPAPGVTSQASWPPAPAEPRAEAPSAPETRRAPGRRRGWGLGGRITEDPPPTAGDTAAEGAGDAAPAGGDRRGTGRPGPYESPDEWFRPEREPAAPAGPGAPAASQDAPPTRPSHRPGPTPEPTPYRPPRPTPEPDPYRRSPQPAPEPEQYRPPHPTPESDSYRQSRRTPEPAPYRRPPQAEPEPDRYRSPQQEPEPRQSRPPHPTPEPDPYRQPRPTPESDSYRRSPRPDPDPDPYHPSHPAQEPGPYGGSASADRHPASPRVPHPAQEPDPYTRDAVDREPRPVPAARPDRPDGPDGPADPPTPDRSPSADVPPRRTDLSKAPAESGVRPPQAAGADAYPRPVLPLVAPAWTGPRTSSGRAWAAVRGRGREREAETGLLHKLPAARTVDEARELVERGGNRELLDSLRRPQAYVVLTLLLGEVARRLPSWERPLCRELCEVAIGQEFWAVAPSGASADPSDPPEEQRAANAAELHRWAVRPLLAGGDAPVGTVGELLARLRTSPVPSARETFWLIVDDESPGLPEAVWLTLLKDAYGVPRTARRTGPAPAPGAVTGHPDDPGNGYTRRFLRRAGLLIGGMVAAIVLLVAVRVWFG